MGWGSILGKTEDAMRGRNDQDSLSCMCAVFNDYIPKESFLKFTCFNFICVGALPIEHCCTATVKIQINSRHFHMSPEGLSQRLNTGVEDQGLAHLGWRW